jgi:hypothetical protein
VKIGRHQAEQFSPELAVVERLHCHMVALYAVWYNFIRIHKTLRVTPAMEAGVTDRLFSYEELIGIVDEWEASQKDKES